MKIKKLNINAIQTKMNELGFNQAAIAEKLGCSRESVSNWIKGEKYPYPKHLLELARLLNLKFEQIVLKDLTLEPVIAFRKKANVKTTPEVLERATDIGMLLKHMVSYLPYPKLSRPSSFVKPSLDYYYIQQAAKEVRQILKISTDTIDFKSLISLFIDMRATLIPVMWGEKDKHENALHIYLPDSMTTWIFLNLDVNIIDFKFWMAHELGHIKSPDLLGEEAEDFADEFSGALLFPEDLASSVYKDLTILNNDGLKINKIKALAGDLIISPVTIFLGVNNYAREMNLPQLTFNIHPATRNFYKDYPTVSKIIFNDTIPDAKEYIEKCEEVFGTVFFKILSEYITKEEKKSGFIQRILDLPVVDAEEIYRYIADASKSK
jgi:transcriptional regulator with XRE-family HTH domain